MSESRITALAVTSQPAPARTASLFQTVALSFSRAGAWAVDTAQHFGLLLSILMAPAVFAAYTFAAWSLAANLGWTNTFPYVEGPLSNWLIWAGFAIAVHAAAQVLRRHIGTETDTKN
jgi:hypothetical protein